MYVWHQKSFPELITGNSTVTKSRTNYAGIAMYLTITLLVIFAFLGVELVQLVANTPPQQKIKSIEMMETLDGLAVIENIGDVAANQSVRLSLTNSALPEAQLKGIQFTPALDVRDISLDITVSPAITLSATSRDIPAPPADTVLLFMDISVSGDGADFGDMSTYTDKPVVTFEVEKNPDGTCKGLQLFLLDEARGQWQTDPPYVYSGQDIGSRCSYNGSVPHFSKYYLGLKAVHEGGDAAHIDTKSPSIISYYWKPVSSDTESVFSLNAIMVDDTAVEEATLFYYGPDGYPSRPNKISMHKNTPGWFSADIPSADLGSRTINFWIVAADGAGNSVISRTNTIRLQ